MKLERRVCREAVEIERREGDSATAGTYLVGLSSVFNEWTTLVDQPDYKVREIVRPGAFTAALMERQDVRSLLNHDPNFVLGRTTAGTLNLREVERGLLAETRLSDSQTIRDLVMIPVQRRDISGQSFAFTTRNEGNGETTIDRGDGRMMIRRGGERITSEVRNGVEYVDRELLSLNLFDVTVATYPQYTGASVGVRGEGAREVEDLLAEIRRIRSGYESRSRTAWLARSQMRLRLAECGG
jgi:HK97 family phage prohead protease